MIYLELFWSFVQIGLFSFGGGYAAMPLIRHQVVELHPWLTMTQFSDIITISQMTPGPIAVNSATFVGIRIAGFPGALIATLGCILPSLIVVTILAHVYYKYKGAKALDTVLACLRPVVVALIAAAGLNILRHVLFGDGAPALSSIDWIGAVLFAGAFFALRKFKTNPILTMALCGAGGLIAGLIFRITP